MCVCVCERERERERESVAGVREERREKSLVKWNKMNNISVFIGMCDDCGHCCKKWMDK